MRFLILIDFSTILISSSSIVLIAIVMVYAWRKRANSGALQILIAAAFMAIWAVGSFAELLSVGLEQKLIWRNITQIGVFYMPPACLAFSIVYSGVFKKHKKWLTGISYAIQTISILLIFTDKWLHLMREGIRLVQNGSFAVIAVQSTRLAKLLISFNFIFMASALVLLTIFAVQTRNNMRKQVLITLAGMSIAVVFSLLKVISGESFMPYLPISGVFSLACLTMTLGIIRYDFLMMLPIARNKAFEVIGDGIVVAASQGNIVDANAAACRIFSRHSIQSFENNPECLSKVNALIECHYPDWYEALSHCHSAEMDFQCSSEKATYYYHCNIYVLEKKHHKSLGTISVIHDITEQHMQNALLKHRAERDALLGIYNRHTFIELAGQRLERNPNETCLIFFDLDDFKQVNDNFGHMAGDYVLNEVCRCVNDVLDDRSLFGRFGGEEFAILVSDIDRLQAICIAEALRRCIEIHSFEYQRRQLNVTISIGVAMGNGLLFDQLYQRADNTLYQAKNAGKNCVMI